MLYEVSPVAVRWFCAVFLKIGIDVAAGCLGRQLLPLRLKRGERLVGGCGIGRSDTDEISLAHDFHARHRFRRRAVERVQRRAERGRVQHLAVLHAGALDVERVPVGAGHDVARADLLDRGPGDLPSRRRRQRGAGRDRLL